MSESFFVRGSISSHGLVDLVFPEQKLGIEIDENEHIDRSETKEQERKQTIKEAGITLIRINTGKENFDIDDEISEIQDFICKSSFNLGRQSTINKIVENAENLATDNNCSIPVIYFFKHSSHTQI